MADTDKLGELLDIARLEAPDVPEDVWARIEKRLRLDFGTERVYIAAHRKRAHLDAIAEAGEEASAQELSNLLGVSVRRVRQLRGLKRSR